MKNTRKVRVRLSASISGSTPGLEKLYEELEAIEIAHAQCSNSVVQEAKKKYLMRIFLDYSLSLGVFAPNVSPPTAVGQSTSSSELPPVRTTIALPYPVQTNVPLDQLTKTNSSEEIARQTRDSASHLGIEFASVGK